MSNRGVKKILKFFVKNQIKKLKTSQVKLNLLQISKNNNFEKIQLTVDWYKLFKFESNRNTYFNASKLKLLKNYYIQYSNVVSKAIQNNNISSKKNFNKYAKDKLKKKIILQSIFWKNSKFLKKKLKPIRSNLFKKYKNLLQSKTYWSNLYSYIPLQALFNNKLSVINYNIAKTVPPRKHVMFLREVLRVFPFLKLNRVAANFCASLYTALILKDSRAFATFIKKVMRAEHYKKHALYFASVSRLIRTVIRPQLHYFNCLGLSVVFRGKLGVGGNSRKRVLKYQTGMISSSSKYVKLSRTLDIVRTKTGVVGFTVIVAW